MRTDRFPDGFDVADWQVQPARCRLSRNGRIVEVERYFIEGFTHARRGRDVEDRRETELAARAFEAALLLAPDH